ncbi:MAG: hypothetical protein VW580_00825 [Flavobacteriaceae bacterium]
MIEFLLYASMTCTDASELLARVRQHDNVSELIKQEVIETVKESTPHCKWDAND